MNTSSNGQLNDAKNAKNDEFYTRFQDINDELLAYYRYNKDVFRDKTILLPCDDPEWSNFTKFFALKFDEFGIKKLISTSYGRGQQGKVFTLTRNKPVDERIRIEDLQCSPLKGDGDFRSPEVAALRDEADIIITNPPFSLFREFMAWINPPEKQFLVIGNKNAITYKEIWPLIQSNRMWLGTMPMGRDILFHVPSCDVTTFIENSRKGSAYRVIDGEVMARAAAVWFTNLDHSRRHEPLPLLTMQKLKKYNPGSVQQSAFSKYDNYDAIEISSVKMIPSDYPGTMGVPITFLDKYCPEQFEIIGQSASWWQDTSSMRTSQINRHGPRINDKEIYRRLFIRHRNPA